MEGPVADDAIVQRRRASQRAMLATLLLSRERRCCWPAMNRDTASRGTTTPIAGTTPPRLDWSTADDALTDYVAALIALRRRIPALQQDRWWQQDDGSVQWLNAQGQVLDAQQWEQGDLFMQILLSQRWLLLVNATPQTVEMRLPEGDWQVVAPFTQEDSRAVLPAAPDARSLCVLVRK